jgi:hypothetical protein
VEKKSAAASSTTGSSTIPSTVCLNLANPHSTNSSATGPPKVLGFPVKMYSNTHKAIRCIKSSAGGQRH